METKNNVLESAYKFIMEPALQSMLKEIADKHLPTYREAIIDKTEEGIDMALDSADKFNYAFNFVYKKLREGGFSTDWIRKNEDMVAWNIVDSIKCHNAENRFEGIDLDKMARHHIALKTDLEDFMTAIGIATGVVLGLMVEGVVS